MTSDAPATVMWTRSLTADDLAPLVVIGILAIVAAGFMRAARRGSDPPPVANPVSIQSAPDVAVCNWSPERDAKGLLLKWRCLTCQDTAVSDDPPDREKCRLVIDAAM